MTEYLPTVSYTAYPGKTDKSKRGIWPNKRCNQLKHDSGAAEKMIDEMHRLTKKTSLTKSIKEDLDTALTYFVNHCYLMDYAT
ncbi:MAG: hypothetical protein L3J59_07380 [Methylococcaceae bacterium]|nr:hypothetical protein [Methylococcaceae bacterium]